jgi:hypothetical protein
MHLARNTATALLLLAALLPLGVQAAGLRHVASPADRDLLDHAYYCETEGALSALDAGANINVINSGGFTALMMAALMDCDALAAELIARGADLTPKSADDGLTALDIARVNSPNVADRLEEALGETAEPAPQEPSPSAFRGTPAPAQPNVLTNAIFAASGGAGGSGGPPAGYYECYFYGLYGLQNSSMTSMSVRDATHYEALGDTGGFTYDAGSNTLNLTGGGLDGLVAHIEQSDGKPAIVFLRKENETGGMLALDIEDTWCYFEPR